MRTLSLILTFAVAVQFPAANLRAAETAPRPNLVLIVADDLGYGELGVQGFAKDIPTPHLDSLAKNGVRFTSGYVSCPVCSPTRAGLMTGRYQQRFGHEFNPGPAQNAGEQFGLALKETTLAERLKQLGYATGMFGKWHLGYRPEFHPTRRGFDEFFGFLGGAHSYLDARADEANPIQRGTDPVAGVGYATDEFAAEATSFIERHRAEPFFLYLPFNAVHSPLQATEKYLARFQGIKDDKRRTFAAMLSAMDDGVGRVLGKLRELKLEEQTLVFFISDNGGPTPQTSSGNGPLRGRKGQVWEGGIRVPFVMQWKGTLPAGRVVDAPVIALDIHPTAVAAAGGTISPDWKLDGANLLPFLKGETKTPPHERLFWRFGDQWAVREGDWKLVHFNTSKPELFNLAKDIGETHSPVSEELHRVKTLQAAYAEWNAQLEEPRWRRNAKPEKRRR